MMPLRGHTTYVVSVSGVVGSRRQLSQNPLLYERARLT